MANNLRVLSFILALLSCASCSANDVNTWSGEYLFENELGDDAGISPIVEYDLTIGENGSCSISIEGFQTDEKIVCKADRSANELKINFVSYNDGKVSNALGINVYPVNQPLFYLSRSNKSLSTKWGSLKPDGDVESSGIYFTKIE